MPDDRLSKIEDAEFQKKLDTLKASFDPAKEAEIETLIEQQAAATERAAEAMRQTTDPPVAVDSRRTSNRRKTRKRPGPRRYNPTQPLPVEAERRADTRVLPVISVHPAREHGALFGGLTEGRETTTQLSLPLFPAEATAVRVPLLDLVDAAGLPVMAKGRGAPLLLRFGIRTVISVRPQDRRHKIVRLALRVRELRDGLFPNGWQRNRDWPRLRKTMLDARDYGILDATGGIWFPWAVRRLPPVAPALLGLNDMVLIDLALPPGSATGPIISLPILDQLSVGPVGPFRAWIAVHSIAWQLGRTRVLNPTSKRWAWTRDASRYRILTIKDRHRLAFGIADQKHRTTREIDSAFEALPDVKIIDKKALDPETGAAGWIVVPEDAGAAIRRGIELTDGGDTS